MRKKMLFRMVVVVALLAPVVFCGTETVTPPVVTAWNEDASSPWLTTDYLAKSLPAWHAKQVAWPDAEEIKAASVDVKERLKTRCVEWLKKYIKPEYLPAEIQDKLVAMNDWEGLIDPESSKPPCDVFLVRYTMGGIVIHIQEDPVLVIVAVAPVAAEAKVRTDHKEFFVETAALILQDALLPGTVQSLALKTTTTASGATVCTTSWTPASVIVSDKDGSSDPSYAKAGIVGTHWIGGETDGRFVRFSIYKCTGASWEGYQWDQRF